MDGPLATAFFKYLFAHSSRQCLRKTVTRFPRVVKLPIHRRNAANYSKRYQDPDDAAWIPRNHLVSSASPAELEQTPLVTFEDLKLKNRRPKRVQMLMREYIDDCLYNPSYGYFSKEAVIFNAGEPFDFQSLRSEAAFQRALGDRYTSFEDKLDEKEENHLRQLWHTPTELFRPHYAEAMALFLIENYKISLYPHNDLIIYELGAGNGTFMLEVMNLIRDLEPEVYVRTRYKIVEISSSLANLQRKAAALHGHSDHVQIVNKSIFSWTDFEPSPCFVVALEVIDNFAHDLLRYTGRRSPMQGMVYIDKKGELFETYSHELDPLVARYLRVREAACSLPSSHPLRSRQKWEKLRSKVPFAPESSFTEYVPTRLMQFFDILQSHFPAHRLLLSDFHALPDAVEGYNAPVVQTRFERRMITVTTPLVHQGYFDILFPTDFKVMESIYRAITGKLTKVTSHEHFMSEWANIDETKTKDGKSPLLSWYQNASVMTTV